MPGQGNAAPVFSEPTGRRWQRVRVGAMAAGATSILVVLGLITAALLPPVLPHSNAFDPAAVHRPSPGVSARAARERELARGRLYRELRNGMKVPITAAKVPQRPGAARPPDSILAGFFVNWDEHSYQSLRAHLDRMDWVIAEWGFLAPSGDTVQIESDHWNVMGLVKQVRKERRPKVLLMVSNVLKDSSGHFGGAATERFLASPRLRRQGAERIADRVDSLGLAGVTVDFESVPDSLYASLGGFLDDLRAALGPKRLITQAIQDYLPPEWVKLYAQKCDRLILMLYDEHYQLSDPGPVSGRGWYTEVLDSMLKVIPASKVMMGIGAYGYHWSDAGAKGTFTAETVPDIWQFARDNNVLPIFDPDVSNPYLAWTDADSVDHFIWYLDATSAADEIQIARSRGVTSAAIWKLGGEDPAFWHMYGRHGETHSLDSLNRVIPGYNVNFNGDGELLTVVNRPFPGHRTIGYDSIGTINSVTYDSVPGEWTVARTGARPHKIAITFDDGPDSRWTPSILDTLKSRHATATFFLIGMEVTSSPGLTRRILREGNEIGNHTFTHPNLATTSRWWTRFQIDATQRLFEAILGRRTIFIRTPYLGDNDPSTPEELVPIAIATELGYITVGLKIDGEDWRAETTANDIYDNVMLGRDNGNVVLLHDGGGDRARTVAVLGRIIDSLRAHGDTIVSLGSLADLPPDVVMPKVQGSGSFTRLLELIIFGGVSILEIGFYYLFFFAIVLAMLRLLVVLGLATMQRFRRRRPQPEYTPAVSVVVPAFREEAVIVPTVKSLLAQVYAGTIEVLVVDDGSPDDTFGVATRAFADEPRVRVLTKANGGKSSALNHGIAHATGEIVVALDADTLFDPGAVQHLVGPLADPHVGAVAGNAKVGNRINLVTRWQALEYVTSQNLDRRAFALLDCIMVVPGAIGAWRKSLVLAVGGFSNDTLAEDQDLTLLIGRGGYRVAYADQAIAWTEAPDTIVALAKQRFRWAFGTLQCAWKHRDLLFRMRAGTLGMVALPNVWIFQLMFSIIAPAADLVFVFSLLGVFWMFHEHNTTYSLDSLRKIVAWYAIFITVDWLAATLAFLMEPREDRRLTWLVFLQRFVYRQVMYWVVLRSMVAALRGGLVGWGKLDRKATVGMPDRKPHANRWWHRRNA
ncbi:MAG TPA: glycosyltransferase [Gemmatimonadales bacterium]|jgi:cellulose synthase/poly-beta-1,6-N-acetylglucosamine synthase-like glycosyltransferase/peptidoglycan/xylan/chitin deacetylase (PgdA/CDA1 family)/spore germination protein YaaH